MRADAISACIAIADPLSSDGERESAYRWFEDLVWEWRLARGLVTDEEQWERDFLTRMLEPITQKNGCGSVCATYMVPGNPGTYSGG